MYFSGYTPPLPVPVTCNIFCFNHSKCNYCVVLIIVIITLYCIVFFAILSVLICCSRTYWTGFRQLLQHEQHEGAASPTDNMVVFFKWCCCCINRLISNDSRANVRLLLVFI